MENKKESGKQGAQRRRRAASCDGHTSLKCQRSSTVNHGGKMSSIIITVSNTIFFRLLAHAPEELQREAKEDAGRAIPAFCFTEEDIRERFRQEEQWDEMSEDEQREAIQLLIDAVEYDNVAKLANGAITEAVARYLHDAIIEKEQRQEESEGS